MLAEMPRQILDLPPQLRELLIAGILRIETGLPQIARNRLVRIDELELSHQPGQPIDILLRQLQDFAELACRAAASVRNDIGGHRGAEFAVTLVDILDDTLALITARQIEIDIRPLPALRR